MSEIVNEHLWRDLAPQVLSFLVRRFHDFAAAEDAVQEAMLAASQQWPSEGVPDNPRAWLTQVASRRLTDEVRSNASRRRREQTAAPSPSGYWAPSEQLDVDGDDTLILIQMCCHSSLTPPSAIALTLRAVGGLTTVEIARAFLVPEATMAQRISRAKQTVRKAGAQFAMATGPELEANMRNVMHVLYLMFNEGYTASEGDQLLRTDLSQEATRLTRLLFEGNRGKPFTWLPELMGLLALMLLTDARRRSRSGPLGEAVPLDRQDRSLWDHGLIAEGTALLESALRLGAAGPYQLQAAIAALHDEASTPEKTDWSQIATLYELLLKMGENAMVRLSHAVAVAMCRGTQAGLQLLEQLAQDGVLSTHHRFYAVRGHLLEMNGERARARTDYQAAARLTANQAERDYLLLQAARAGE